MEFTYEPLKYLLGNGLSDLVREQWESGEHEEMRFLPIKPDVDYYQDREEKGELGFVAMREDGKLIGYAAIATSEDTKHAGLRIAFIKDIFITDKKRGHALRFFRYLEKFVQKMGCYCIDVCESARFEQGRGGVGKFYQFMGFAPLEVTWRKVLGRDGSA